METLIFNIRQSGTFAKSRDSPKELPTLKFDHMFANFKAVNMWLPAIEIEPVSPSVAFQI